MLMTSQAYVSFCSSGLETSLSYVIVVLFYLPYFSNNSKHHIGRWRLFYYSSLVSFAAVNRLDTLIIFVPAWLGILYQTLQHYNIKKICVIVLLSQFPLFLWFGVAVVYFGFFLPNSYYAKLGLDFSTSVLLQNGVTYLIHCLKNDPATIIIIVSATIFSLLFFKKTFSFLLAQVGSVAYVSYIVKAGGDFLGYRFFSVPFLISTLVITHIIFLSVNKKRHDLVTFFGVAAAILYSMIIPATPLRIVLEKPTQPDVRAYYDASALRAWSPGKSFPFAQFHAIRDIQYAHQMRADQDRVSVTGGGMRGFVRGPKDHLVDPQSITDPLMARLPFVKKPWGNFTPAHIMKPIPAGYVESIEFNRNMIKDPDLAQYYQKLRTIVSGPIWSKERFVHIIEFNFSNLSRYRQEYVIQVPPYQYDRR